MKIVEIKDFIEDQKKLENLIRQHLFFPECHMHIFFQNISLSNKQAVFVPKDLIKLDSNSHEYTSIGYRYNADYRWDCHIAVSSGWYEKRSRYPAYFYYLIGHELGHANIYFNDPDLHIFCQLIESNIREASHDSINCHYQCPHEILFDRFGKYFSNKIANSLSEEIEEIKNTTNQDEKVRLNLIQELEPTNHLENLRNDLVEFASPYKPELTKIWKKSIKKMVIIL